MGKNEDNCTSNIILRQLKKTLHTICLTLLSLLLPLSYLLFARLNSPPFPPLTINTIILYIILSFISLTSLFSSFTCHKFPIKFPNCIVWAVMFICQACVTFGIETTIRCGFEPVENNNNTSYNTWLKRSLLFIGIYEQMMLWEKMFVKFVVDDAMYNEERKEKGIERFIMGLCFGGLWLWVLQREMEPLVLVFGRFGWRNFILWLVTFATLLIGFVRVVEFVVWEMIGLLQFMYCGVVDEDGDWYRLGENEV